MDRRAFFDARASFRARERRRYYHDLLKRYYRFLFISTRSYSMASSAVPLRERPRGVQGSDLGGDPAS
jgi:hypothetical protein